MHVHPFRQRRPQANADINLVPLIDIMLVLVIIFLVTAPLLTRAIKVDLPDVAAAIASPKAATINLVIDGTGQLYWEREPLAWSALAARLGVLKQSAEEPEIHIRADREIAYQHVMRLMSAVAAAELSKIGFVTEPVPHD